jgi:hypothetical protein
MFPEQNYVKHITKSGAGVKKFMTSRSLGARFQFFAGGKRPLENLWKSLSERNCPGSLKKNRFNLLYWIW